LGTDVLNGIVACSRDIGRGWVGGGLVAETKLMKLTRDTVYIERYVVGLFDFLFGLFEEDRPNLVFCHTLGTLAYGLSRVCEHLGVPFRRLTYARVGTRCILDDSPEGVFGPVGRTYKAAQNNPTELEPYLPEARTYLKRIRSMPEQPEYTKVIERKQKKKRSIIALPRQFGNVLLAGLKTVVGGSQREWHVPSDLARRWRQFAANLETLKLSLASPFHAIGDLPDKPFAYYPLHMEPEEAMMVRSPLHTNQLAVIEALSKSLPFHMGLVVKEAYAMLGRRPRGFYSAIGRMPKVTLASPFESTFVLIQRADLTCVITGTAAWEAMMLKKPALVIGENFPYLGVGEDIAHCPDLTRLSTAISSALTGPPASDECLELFLASVFYHSFDFPFGLVSGRVSREVIEDHRDVLGNICDRLEAAVSSKN
jgi:hypothetical protein